MTPFARAACLAALALSASAAPAALLNVNVTGDLGTANSNGPGAGPGNLRALAGQSAGVLPSIVWNNFVTTSASANGTLPGLVGTAGPTAASVTLAGFEVAYTAHPAPPGSSGDAILTNGYADNSFATPATVTFDNLPFVGPYDVYVYVASDVNGRTGTGTIGTTTYPFTTSVGGYTGAKTFDGAYDRGSEYLLFTGVTGSSFTYSQISPDLFPADANNSGVAGIQISGNVPEPAGLALVGLAAGAGLLARRRPARR